MKTRVETTEHYQVSITRDRKSGTAVHEQWTNEKGESHRLHGPSQVSRDPATGVIVKELWQQNGHLERLDGPAVIRRNAKTGAITFLAWYRNGVKIAAPKGSSPRSSGSTNGPGPRPS